MWPGSAQPLVSETTRPVKKKCRHGRFVAAWRSADVGRGFRRTRILVGELVGRAASKLGTSSMGLVDWETTGPVAVVTCARGDALARVRALVVVPGKVTLRPMRTAASAFGDAAALSSAAGAYYVYSGWAGSALRVFST